MSGNVEEWCWDVVKDSLYPGKFRYVRGGSWLSSNRVMFCFSGGGHSGLGRSSIGFRVVMNN
ncbi:MAG: SUMF1/EgtB/PvdO family nonheme iron enzyme [Bacteroidales bacterium]|nr:SUMF1/EgtB/PvdO family nonheme iron enzyme [Bacteroidales bacterium]